jgi:hypothetical protein
MYIRKVNIEYIRSIDQFQMTFPKLDFSLLEEARRGFGM